MSDLKIQGFTPAEIHKGSAALKEVYKGSVKVWPPVYPFGFKVPSITIHAAPGAGFTYDVEPLLNHVGRYRVTGVSGHTRLLFNRGRFTFILPAGLGKRYTLTITAIDREGSGITSILTLHIISIDYKGPAGSQGWFRWEDLGIMKNYRFNRTSHQGFDLHFVLYQRVPLHWTGTITFLYTNMPPGIEFNAAGKMDGIATRVGSYTTTVVAILHCVNSRGLPPFNIRLEPAVFHWTVF